MHSRAFCPVKSIGSMESLCEKKLYKRRLPSLNSDALVLLLGSKVDAEMLAHKKKEMLVMPLPLT